MSYKMIVMCDLCGKVIDPTEAPKSWLKIVGNITVERNNKDSIPVFPVTRLRGWEDRPTPPDPNDNTHHAHIDCLITSLT